MSTDVAFDKMLRQLGDGTADVVMYGVPSAIARQQNRSYPNRNYILTPPFMSKGYRVVMMDQPAPWSFWWTLELRNPF